MSAQTVPNAALNGHNTLSHDELKQLYELDRLSHVEIPTPPAPVPSMPPLPASAQLLEELGRDACPWLDAYIDHSAFYSPRSYFGFHEANALFVLSTIAARRVVLHFGGERFTNLSIALIARTSIWAKSSATRIAIDLIDRIGLRYLLAPDDSTPQAFIARMNGRVPSSYHDLPPEKQAMVKLRLAFAAQSGWFYEEFGQKLNAMMREGGAMADYRGVFRRLDDCPEHYEVSTIGRGDDVLQRPYLSLLANMTPADMAPHAKENSALWSDGFFARFAFVTPPKDATPSQGRYPPGQRTIPASLTLPLIQWHNRLGVPDVDIEERHDEKGKPTGEYTATVAPMDPKRATLGDGVYDAFYAYSDALRDVLMATGNETLDGSYTRLPEKALRIALLLASLSNNDVIEMRHWARAQQIAERWRANLHSLIEQVQTTQEASKAARLEDKLVSVIREMGEPTVRDMRANHLRAYSTEEINKELALLVKNGIVVSTDTKRSTKYSLAGEA